MTRDRLTYEGFIGSVHFSSEDEIFYGKIEDINDLVTFEGKTVATLKKAFYEAVDDYRELCKTLGKDAFKSYSGTFNVRVAKETHQIAAREATLRGISLNKFVEGAIRVTIRDAKTGKFLQSTDESIKTDYKRKKIKKLVNK